MGVRGYAPPGKCKFVGCIIVSSEVILDHSRLILTQKYTGYRAFKFSIVICIVPLEQFGCGSWRVGGGSFTPLD